MATLRDVAQAAGVSASVVSRVLNEAADLRVRPETRARILQALRDLDYAPNHAARGLRLGQSSTIGLVVPSLANAYFAELLRGAEVAAEESGHAVLLARAERVGEGGDYLRRLVREGRVDGFILQATDEAATESVLDRMTTNLPVVLINARSRHAGSVVLDDVAAARTATDHLLTLGHRRIGHIGGLPGSFTARRREQGYVAALHGAGLRRRRAWCTSLGYQPQDGRAAIHELWARPGPAPTGLVVANVNAGLGVLAGLRDVGVRVPQEVSVVAIHDSGVAALMAPALTTVQLPLYELGIQAVRDLVVRLSAGPARHSVVSDPAAILRLRESTAPPVH
ncbi:MAG: LacI family DNA-binding transcriptional regulator [Phycicoccus sp.]|nr:LacI family DNA-binding transcriptional regulator [Phycicoccus sp.]